MQEEIAWFAPALRVHLLPDWETLPYDSFSPHQDLISERLATLYAVARGDCDVLIAAAATALARMAPPSHLVGHTFFLKKGDRLDLDKLRAQLDAGRLPACHAGGRRRRIQRARRADRPVPDGHATALPHRAVRRRGGDAAHLRRRLASARSIRCRRSACCRRASFRSASRAATSSAAASARPSRATPRASRSTRTFPTARCRPASSTTCRCSSTRRRRCSTTCPRTRGCSPHHDVPAAIAEFWRDTTGRHDMLGGDRSRPVLPPRDLFLSDEAVLRRRQALPRYHLAGEVDAGWRGCRRSRWTARPTSRSPRCGPSSTALPAACCWRPNRRGAARPSPTICAEYGLHAEPCADFAAFVDRRCALHARRRAALGRLRAAGGAAGDRHRERAVRRHRPAARPARGRRGAPTSKAGCATFPNCASATRWCMSRTASAATWAWCTWTSAKATPSSCISNTPRAPSSTCRSRNCTSSRATAAPTRSPIATAHARLRPVGQGEEEGRRAGARHRRRTAAPLRPARRAPGPRVRLQAARPGSLRRRFRFRGNARPAAPPSTP